MGTTAVRYSKSVCVDISGPHLPYVQFHGLRAAGCSSPSNDGRNLSGTWGIFGISKAAIELVPASEPDSASPGKLQICR
jgi:hypothetical protein